MNYKRITQFFLSGPKKRDYGTHVRLSEIRSSECHFLYSQENSLHNVFHINKSKVLTPETHREINMLLNRFRHQVIIFSRAVRKLP